MGVDRIFVVALGQRLELRSDRNARVEHDAAQRGTSVDDPSDALRLAEIAEQRDDAELVRRRAALGRDHRLATFDQLARERQPEPATRPGDQRAGQDAALAHASLPTAISSSGMKGGMSQQNKLARRAPTLT